MDEISDPSLTLKVLGHQWYWSYEISDFNTCLRKFNSLKFTSYMLAKDQLRDGGRKGFFRILETGKRIIIPTNTHIRLLVTATDGNHGYGVAFIAKLFKCKAKILMPQGTVPARAERIRALGAECHVLDVNYDTCVERARDLAARDGGLYIQDTALESDTEEERQTPLAIMQVMMLWSVMIMMFVAGIHDNTDRVSRTSP